jgi:hypothetical protein
MDQDRYAAAPDFPTYLDHVEKNAELWRAVYDRVRLPADLVERARALEGTWYLAALSEDWCGDAVNTLPVVARLAEEVGWELRVFGRDDNPDLMDAHLTGGTSRSIPVVMVYDEGFRETGWWGPRPAELQAWVLEEGLQMPSAERYKVTRGWYARDRGRATLEEVLDVFPVAAPGR